MACKQLCTAMPKKLNLKYVPRPVLKDFIASLPGLMVNIYHMAKPAKNPNL